MAFRSRSLPHSRRKTPPWPLVPAARPAARCPHGRRPLDIPTSIDDPPLLLLWPVDDLALIVLTLVVRILTGSPRTLYQLLILGVLLVCLYTKFRERRPDGYALHLLYWHGLRPLRGRTTPNPFARRWLP